MATMIVVGYIAYYLGLPMWCKVLVVMSIMLKLIDFGMSAGKK